MAKKKKQNIYELVGNLERNLFDSYRRWKKIFTEGCSDPNWRDGVNIDLVRNHINSYKRQIEGLLLGRFYEYPDSYWYPDPVRLPYDFMAVDRKIIQEDSIAKANNTLSYDEVMFFDWGEVM